MSSQVRFFTGTKEQYLSLADHNSLGLYFCENTNELFWGDRCISDGIRVIPTYDDLPELSYAADGIVYYVHDTRNGYILSPDRTEWIQTIYAPVADMSSVPEGEEYNVVATVGAVRDLEEELRMYIDEQVALGGGTMDYGEI